MTKKQKLDAVVSGATGLVGRWLVPILTARGREVGVLVRDATKRSSEYRAWVTSHGGDASRVHFFESDLGAKGLGLGDDDRAQLATAEDFFHLGAAMQYGLAVDEARRINVDGTRELLEIARVTHERGALRRFIHVGGFKLNDRDANDHDGNAKRLGGYELSKIEADTLARGYEATYGMPITRIQPSGIIGDSSTGETTQYWGFSDLVRDLFFGKLPAIIGGDGYWVPLCTVDWVAQFLARLVELDAGDIASEYTLLDDTTPNLDQLVERVARHLGVEPVRRAIPKGMLETFLRMGGDRLTGVSTEALSFVGNERYDLDATKRAAKKMSLDWPDLDRAILRAADFLLSTRFGKARSQSRDKCASKHMQRVAGIPTWVEGSPSTCDALFLHGIPLDASSWDSVIDELDERVTTGRADLPGLARTAKTIDRAWTWMEALLAGHADKPWIVGHSLGTGYAVEHAARHPDRVAGLVLVAPFFLQKPPPIFLRSGLTASLAMSLMQESDLEKLVGRGKDRVDAPRDWISRPGARSRMAKALVGAHASRESLQAKLRALAESAMRITIVTGERDPIVEDVAKGIDVVTLTNTGHYPQLDAPIEVARVVSRVVAARKSGAILRAA